MIADPRQKLIKKLRDKLQSKRSSTAAVVTASITSIDNNKPSVMKATVVKVRRKKNLLDQPNVEPKELLQSIFSQDASRNNSIEAKPRSYKGGSLVTSFNNKIMDFEADLSQTLPDKKV